ncbi:N-acetylmuramoyl-L-alanine amidase [Prochlorococcus sp. MIT 1307]|uniref:N-acetylmuramoyl-L-alanine amidase n=1 Tax=Prochlorococcus sp. MIT 1307 TaxID=3096219 RepID=UPI002A7487B1|nr:N-acetylmuramoyl-L-alanine amidase [Prochlorococcus sp. MIT 1307]
MRNALLTAIGLFGFWGVFDLQASTEKLPLHFKDPLLGSRVGLKSEWLGTKKVSPSLSFLILAGHADSQGIAGAGTAGEAVDLKGKMPMDPSMSDELFWNMKVRDAIVQLGRERGLNINSYDPGIRNIVDGNHPSTNWSVGSRHVREGGYAIEIHFDSYGEYGFGSGLIPAISRSLNSVDESLARSFGRYPIFFRGGLGAPRRGIRILEIGKLEGKLERNLRDINSRDKVVKQLASRVVQAITQGISSK